jgi:hypothetical protein
MPNGRVLWLNDRLFGSHDWVRTLAERLLRVLGMRSGACGAAELIPLSTDPMQLIRLFRRVHGATSAAWRAMQRSSSTSH